jgi:hypothetical protein
MRSLQMIANARLQSEAQVGGQGTIEEDHLELEQVFAFGRPQSCLPEALESLFDTPSPPDPIEIGY